MQRNIYCDIELMILRNRDFEIVMYQVVYTCTCAGVQICRFDGMMVCRCAGVHTHYVACTYDVHAYECALVDV